MRRYLLTLFILLPFLLQCSTTIKVVKEKGDKVILNTNSVQNILYVIDKNNTIIAVLKKVKENKYKVINKAPNVILTNKYIIAELPPPPRKLNFPMGKWYHKRFNYVYKGKRYSIQYSIYMPIHNKNEKSYLMIALHGWNGNSKDWQKYSNIGYYADIYNVIIVSPNMGVSYYSTQFFKETTMKWGPLPGAVFIDKIFLPQIKKQLTANIYDAPIAIMGISTGGRGAVIIGEYFNKEWDYIGSLSGDFDIMPNDNLTKAILGPFPKFKHRWETVNNGVKHANRLRGKKIFLAHGKRDTIVPYTQTVKLHKKLKELKIAHLYLIDDNAQHNWNFWNKYFGKMFEYFYKK